MKSAAILVFAVLLAAAAAAETVVLEEIGVTVPVPDGWEIDQSGASLSGVSADGEVWMQVWAENADTVQDAIDKVLESLAETVTQYDVFMRGEVLWDGWSREPTTADAYYLAGLGIVGEQVMDYSVAIVDSGDQVVVVLVYYDGYDDKTDEHQEIARPILTGVEVIR